MKRKRRSTIPLFKFREHCIYCGETCAIDNACKNPNRLVPAYLVTEMDTKEVDERGKHVSSKDRILKQCKIRADDWADVVLIRVTGILSDLLVSDARYYKDCLSRIFSQRSAPGDSKEGNKLMRADRTKTWDSVGLQERFTELVGSCIKRSELLRMLSRHADDLVILSAPGCRKVVMFHDNARSTLKVTKDDGEEDNIGAALNVIVKAIKAEVVAIEHENNTYTRNISMSIAAESVSGTIQLLLQKLSHSLGAESLTSLLIGALGVLIHRKKIIKHMFDYKVTCSSDELRRYKKSSAVARYTKLRRKERVPVIVSGLVKHIADNFDADMSSPNGVHILTGHDRVFPRFRQHQRTSIISSYIHRRNEEISPLR